MNAEAFFENCISQRLDTYNIVNFCSSLSYLLSVLLCLTFKHIAMSYNEELDLVLRLQFLYYFIVFSYLVIVFIKKKDPTS